MDYQIEEQIIGYIMLKPENMKKIVINEDYFLDSTNNFIFKLLLKQYNDYQVIDLTGLVENYKHLFNNRFKINDVIMKLSRIVSDTLIVNDFDYYQELLLSRYIEHKILEVIKSFQNQQISKEEMLQDIHKFESMNIKTNDGVLSSEEIFKLINSKNKTIDFRFKAFAERANIQEHDFVVIGARTGVGKTGFLLNLIEDISNKYKCLYFNLEMSEKQLYQRLVAINTKIPTYYHDKLETEYQKQKLIEGCKNISSKKIRIIEHGQTVNSIRRIIINESKDEHIVAFIDYFGLIKSTEKNQSSYERGTNIVKELRQITLDYNCTIILASQLNRNADSKDEPKISELKETGELEQSATTVLMLHDENHSVNMNKDEIEMTIIIGKNRNGKIGRTKLRYNKLNQRYDENTKNFNKEPGSFRKE